MVEPAVALAAGREQKGFALVQCPPAGLNYADHVYRGQLVLTEAEGLAEQAFFAVALDGCADATRDADAEAGEAAVVGRQVNGHAAASERDSRPENGVELVPSADALALAKGVSFRHDGTKSRSVTPAGCTV